MFTLPGLEPRTPERPAHVDSRPVYSHIRLSPTVDPGPRAIAFPRTLEDNCVCIRHSYAEVSPHRHHLTAPGTTGRSCSGANPDHNLRD